MEIVKYLLLIGRGGGGHIVQKSPEEDAFSTHNKFDAFFPVLLAKVPCRNGELKIGVPRPVTDASCEGIYRGKKVNCLPCPRDKSL